MLWKFITAGIAISPFAEEFLVPCIGQWKAPKPSGQSMGGPGYLGGGGGVVRPKIVATLKKNKVATFSDQLRFGAKEYKGSCRVVHASITDV